MKNTTYGVLTPKTVQPGAACARPPARVPCYSHIRHAKHTRGRAFSSSPFRHLSSGVVWVGCLRVALLALAVLQAKLKPTRLRSAPPLLRSAVRAELQSTERATELEVND